jgi:hypothetical protein
MRLAIGLLTFDDMRKLQVGEQARGSSDEEWSRGAGLATATGVIQIGGGVMAPIDPAIILCRSKWWIHRTADKVFGQGNGMGSWTMLLIG